MDELVEAAKLRGAECESFEGVENLLKLSESKWRDVFCVVTVGGDGTILSAVSAASLYNKPVLGVNMGRVGFFSEIGTDEFSEALSKLFANDYYIEKPSMLHCEVNGECMGDCLNDFIIHRQELSSITHLELDVDGDSIGDVMADGLAVSTPSGSTAYTMSAGGPVVAPKLDCILVTPICPHSLTVRPIVASRDSVVSVRLKCTCRLSCDGQGRRILDPGDTVTFTRSDRTAEFIRFKKRNVFKLIREKLR